MKSLHVGLAVCACMVWGINAVINKIGLTDLPPLTLALLRFSFALPFLPFLKFPNVPLYKIALLSVCMAGQWIFVNLALKLGCSASLCALITQAGSPLCYVLAYLHCGAKPNGRQYLSLTLTGLGILALSFDAHKSATLEGLLCALMVAVCFALVAFLTQLTQPKGAAFKDDVAFSVWACAIAFFMLLPVVAIFEGRDAFYNVLHISWAGFGCVAYSGLLANLMGMVAITFLIRQYSAAEATKFTALVPICGVAGGYLFLGESFTPNMAIAAPLIIAGLFVKQTTRR